MGTPQTGTDGAHSVESEVSMRRREPMDLTSFSPARPAETSILAARSCLFIPLFRTTMIPTAATKKIATTTKTVTTKKTATKTTVITKTSRAAILGNPPAAQNKADLQFLRFTSPKSVHLYRSVTLPTCTTFRRKMTRIRSIKATTSLSNSSVHPTAPVLTLVFRDPHGILPRLDSHLRSRFDSLAVVLPVRCGHHVSSLR
ncbi:hypothetical protein EV401DRAFT_925345 [Pisolithus croceorrhizus]|nr:hypothetical protein EV401DRAFT_925345 [Pisolithus croceorrhizus]